LSLASFGHYKVEPAELRERTLTAIEESARYAGLQEEMVRVLQDSRSLAHESIERTRACINDLGLDDLVVGRGRRVTGEAALDALFKRLE
jgi:hypothetical protein